MMEDMSSKFGTESGEKPLPHMMEMTEQPVAAYQALMQLLKWSPSMMEVLLLDIGVLEVSSRLVANYRWGPLAQMGMLLRLGLLFITKVTPIEWGGVLPVLAQGSKEFSFVPAVVVPPPAVMAATDRLETMDGLPARWTVMEVPNPSTISVVVLGARERRAEIGDLRGTWAPQKFER